MDACYDELVVGVTKYVPNSAVSQAEQLGGYVDMSTECFEMKHVEDVYHVVVHNMNTCNLRDRCTSYARSVAARLRLPMNVGHDIVYS